jgi:CO dehydrogenase maturation factor
MILGFLGKGGSGKSSVSWLASQVLLEDDQRVLAIDADHNMDLAHIYDRKVDGSTPTLHRAHDLFLRTVKHNEDSKWHKIVLDEERALPNFQIDPPDHFTEQVTESISNKLDLMVVGLGAEDVLFSSRCAHGHTAPLKYYLPLLRLYENQWSIVDGVAGVDMMNFGLFTGADAVVVVVEPHQNSIRVYREVKRIAEESELPLYAIINKSEPGSVRDSLVAELGAKLLAELPLDEGLRRYDYSALNNELKVEMRRALEYIRSNEPKGNGLSRLRRFEKKRQASKK